MFCFVFFCSNITFPSHTWSKLLGGISISDSGTLKRFANVHSICVSNELHTCVYSSSLFPVLGVFWRIQGPHHFLSLFQNILMYFLNYKETANYVRDFTFKVGCCISSGRERGLVQEEGKGGREGGTIWCDQAVHRWAYKCSLLIVCNCWWRSSD